MKVEFSHEGPCIVYFDGKKLPAISRKSEKEDRVAVVVSGIDMEKLLGIQKVGQGTGEQVAKVVNDMITE